MTKNTFLDVFCNFYLVKNHKIADNLTMTKAREKISTDWESLEFTGVCLTNYKNNQNLLYKIIHQFPVTAKLLTGWNITIDKMVGQAEILVVWPKVLEPKMRRNKVEKKL